MINACTKHIHMYIHTYINTCIMSEYAFITYTSDWELSPYDNSGWKCKLVETCIHVVKLFSKP